MIGETGLRRDTPLSRRIKEIIRRDGPMTIQTYMSHCLWDADYGYYRKQPIFGAAGDFITAADISQVFGELIGVWAGVVWQGVLGAPNPVTLVEYGPGRGTMMRDVLRAARIVPGFANVARVHLVEASDALAEITPFGLNPSGIVSRWINVRTSSPDAARSTTVSATSATMMARPAAVFGRAAGREADADAGTAGLGPCGPHGPAWSWYGCCFPAGG